jgi:hypothetical protein
MYVQVIRDYNYPKIPHEIHILTFMLVIFSADIHYSISDSYIMSQAFETLSKHNIYD